VLCIESPCAPARAPAGRRRAAASLLLLAGLAGCHSPMPPDPAPRAPVAAARPAVPPPAARAPATTTAVARDWTEYRVQAALKMVAANPGRSYTGPVPEPLLAIPVLEIELNADGSIRHITVLREPREVKDTIQLAIDAVKRAAPFGDVTRLPKPWKFTEVFLFDDERRFKPRALD